MSGREDVELAREVGKGTECCLLGGLGTSRLSSSAQAGDSLTSFLRFFHIQPVVSSAANLIPNCILK